MKKSLPVKLPEVEWNFADVANEEIRACLIWEYGRSANGIRELIPDYNSPSDVRAKLPNLTSPPASVALNLLHRMLQELARWKENAINTAYISNSAEA